MCNPEDFKFFDGKWGKRLVRTNIRTVIKMSNNSIATISTLVLFLNNRLGSFKGRLLDTLIPLCSLLFCSYIGLLWKETKSRGMLR